MWDLGTGREGLVGLAKGGGNGWDWNIEDGSVDVQMVILVDPYGRMPGDNR